MVCECGKAKTPTLGVSGHPPRWCRVCPTKDPLARNVTAKRCVCEKAIPSFGFVVKAPLYCFQCKPEGAFNVISKKCECGKTQPSLGYEGQPPRWCRKCPNLPTEARNLKAKRCQCKKALPSFGFEWRKPLFCKDCKPSDAFNVINKQCECGSARANFGFEADRISRWCSKCKPEGTVSLKVKRCVCKRAEARFGYELRRPLYCAQCRPEGTRNVVSRPCECRKALPVYGSQEGEPKYCLDCRTPGTIDVRRKRCICKKAFASFGFVQGLTLFCKECRPSGAKNVKWRLCACGEHEARFALPGGLAEWCQKCKTEGAVDVKSKLCGCGRAPHFSNGDKTEFYCTDCAPLGTKRIRSPCVGDNCPGSSLNPAYDGYCARCFVHLFPDKPVARNYRTKERLVIERLKPVLAAEFPNLETSFDRSVSGGCSRRRPDVFVDALTHSVIGEIDEEGHDTEEYCSCENKRMMLLFQDLGNRPIAFVRINPDAYVDAKGVKHPSCFGRDKSGKLVVTDEPEWDKRVDLFIERMRYHLKTVPEREVTVEHLYYNGFC